MPILGIIASSISGSTFGSYESISTVTVGSGGSASISFTSIPATYTHLQIRVFGQTSRATYGNDQMTMRVNGDTGSTYSSHNFYGTGTAVTASGLATQTNIDLTYKLGTTNSSAFGAFIIDILDYANTSKYKTIRNLAGVDINGTIASYGGEVGLSSGLWQSTSAITSLSFTATANFTQYSSFALYGIKGV
jgi:hypothetical protein